MATGQIVLMTGLCLAAFVAVAIELRWRARMDLIDQYRAKGDGTPATAATHRNGRFSSKMGLQQTEAIFLVSSCLETRQLVHTGSVRQMPSKVLCRVAFTFRRISQWS
jgi:hypothetical protein